MKTLIILLLIVIVGSVYFYYDFEPADVPTEVTVAELDVVNEAPTSTPAVSAKPQLKTFSNAEYDFSFDYRIKPYGYSVFENTAEQNLDQNMLFGATLVRTDDYNESVKAAEEGNAHDGPPAMSVYVFAAENVKDVGVWLTQNKIITNCEPGSVKASTISGKDASSCLWDGLYLGVTTAVLNNDKIYVLTGTRESSETKDGYSYEKDFNEVVSSFELSK